MTWLRKVRGILCACVAVWFLPMEAAQQSDGRIVFGAAEAKQDRGGQNEAKREVLSWKEGSEVFSWDYKPTRWGMYDLGVEYSDATANGEWAEVVVEIAGQLYWTGL